LAIKYRDPEGIWREDGIKNVHMSYDMLSFTVTHLTSFALLSVHSAPSHVSVQAVSEAQIDLSWDDNSEDEIGFEVWRCINDDISENKNYSRLTITDPSVTSYSDISCQMDNTYTYKIRAVTELGATTYSIPAGKVLNDCAFAPKAPQDLRIRSVSSKEVVLEWTDASGCESGFDIYRKTGTGGVYVLIHSPAAGETTYKDTDVVAGQTYYYMVKATSDEGDSEPSNELMVAVPGAPSAPAPGPIKGDGGTCFLSALDAYGSSLGRWIAELTIFSLQLK
jgi:fibronectin type 3 domain-containing protein